MNRTLSCTVNEQALAKAFAFLDRNNYGPNTLAGIARLCVEMVAMQLENEPTERELEDFAQIAYGVGRVSAKRPQMRGFVIPQANVMATQQQQQQPIQVDDRLWWQQLGCCSESEGHEYSGFLRENKLTPKTCSYTEWHKHKLGVVNVLQKTQTQTQTPTNETPADCDPSLPIAATESFNALEEKALERQQREADEKRQMEEFMRGLANGQKGSE
jgi:hypothetical protein